VATGGEGDVFGAAVALDGEHVWVGAPVTRGLETGMAVVFAGDGEPSTMRFTAEETNHEDSFGHRVVAGGGIGAVTASGLDHQAGGVFVYERGSDGEWTFAGELVSPPDAMGAVVGEERRCTDGEVESFGCDAVELLAYIPSPILTAPEDARGVRVNDNWGWTDPATGREYALVGRNDGTSFVDITDPTNPVLLGDLPKTPNTPRSQLWRDIKTFKNHAYIVADGAGAHGMQVFDLTRLRDVEDPPVKFEPDLLYRGVGQDVVESSHNVIINEDTGFAYLTSRQCAGMHMVDINEPMNPTFVGCSEPGPTHDAQCIIYDGPDAAHRGREICFRMAGDRFQISDVTDKSNPVELATASHPNPAYMHQGWVTEDHRYFIMDDESDVIAGNVETTRTLIWNLDNLEDPVLVKEFFGSLPASAHNLYVKGDFTYQANYKYGLHILDTSDPLNPIEVGMFDTSPYGDGSGFGGAWSNYPFFESGSILVTSMQEGLFVLKKRPVPVS
jgi:choice-of-anchor B domain-containing protein